MSTKLIWVTPESEALIAYCARVSSSNQSNPEYKSLIHYLIKNKHWSPFELASMCIEIQTTRAISAQILRHRSFSFQEFSQRYAINNNVEMPNFRQEHPVNRQSSLELHDKNNIYQEKVLKLYADTFSLYKEMLADGVAKETARFILPLSTTTTLYMCGNIRSWIHYLQIRTDEHTQDEHRKLALEIKQLFKEQLPIIYDSVFND